VRQSPLPEAIGSNRHCEDRDVRGNPEWFHLEFLDCFTRHMAGFAMTGQGSGHDAKAMTVAPTPSRLRVFASSREKIPSPWGAGVPIKGVEHPPLDPLALHAVFDSLQGRGGSARNGPSTILRMVPLPIECNGEDHTFASPRLCVNQISYPAQFRYPPRHANPYRRASFFFARPSGRAVFLYQNRVPCGPSRRICAKPDRAQRRTAKPGKPAASLAQKPRESSRLAEFCGFTQN